MSEAKGPPLSLDPEFPVAYIQAQRQHRQQQPFFRQPLSRLLQKGIKPFPGRMGDPLILYFSHRHGHRKGPRRKQGPKKQQQTAFSRRKFRFHLSPSFVLSVYFFIQFHRRIAVQIIGFDLCNELQAAFCRIPFYRHAAV